MGIYRPRLILRLDVHSARGLSSRAAEDRLDEPRGNGIVTPVEANYFCLESEIYNGKPNRGRSPVDSVRAVPIRRFPSTQRSCNCNLEL
jgi:hypothetical protein